MVEERNRRDQRNQDILEWFEALSGGFAVMLLVFTFLFRVAVVDGHSMEPTLQDQDRVILRSVAYAPDYGDVICVDAYCNYGKPLCKRVIAKGGDQVDIDFDSGIVSVNGEALQEDYVAELTRLSEGVSFPLTVPDGCLFVMGDNRMHSSDSRCEAVGFIDERDVLGKAIWRIFPVSKFGGIG